MKHLIFAIGAALLMSSCTHTNTYKKDVSKGKSVDKFELKVSLYPWIPEPEKFAKWIQSEFNRENPDIDLIVRPMKTSRDWDAGVDLSYNLDSAAGALALNDFGDGQHIVEIDTMLLGDLVKKKAIQKFSVERSDFYPFAEQAVTYENDTWGVPHWTCGYFLISTNETVSKSNNAIELRQSLLDLNTPYPDLGGDLDGSWTSLAVYLDAFMDTFPDRSPSDALKDNEINSALLPYLRALKSSCNQEDSSTCDDYEKRAFQFGEGKLDALIAYSERLHLSLSGEENDPRNVTLSSKDILVTPAPLGAGKTPYFFTDALVLSKNCNTDRCKDAAQRFAEFYIRNDVFKSSMLGADYEKNNIPRYLLPSTKEAMLAEGINSDPIYRQIEPYMHKAISYPNYGVPDARLLQNPIRKQLNKELHNKID